MGNRLSICADGMCAKLSFMIPCDVAGSFGCFICLNGTKYKLYDFFQDKLSAVFEPKDKYKWKYILEHAKNQNLCLKIFKPSDNAYEYKEEMKRVKALSEILNEKELLTYTTHRRVDGEYGFSFAVADEHTVELLDQNDGRYLKLNEVSFMFLESCQDYRYYKSPNIDARKIIDDVSPLLNKLHRNGYAHGDIKFYNMVYCDSFKLIDIGMLSDTNWTDCDYTYECCAPVFLKHYADVLSGKGKTMVSQYILEKYKMTYNKNYTTFIKQYGLKEALEGIGGVWESLLKRGTDMDICQYNDQYYLAYLLHSIDAVGREPLIKALLTKPGYFKRVRSTKKKSLNV